MQGRVPRDCPVRIQYYVHSWTGMVSRWRVIAPRVVQGRYKWVVPEDAAPDSRYWLQVEDPAVKADSEYFAVITATEATEEEAGSFFSCSANDDLISLATQAEPPCCTRCRG